MDQIATAALGALTWIWENPAAALVVLVTGLTVLVTAYHRLEPRIKTYVRSTTWTWDDEALDGVDAFFRFLDEVLRFLRLFLPGAVERARQPSPCPTREHPSDRPPPPPGGP